MSTAWNGTVDFSWYSAAVFSFFLTAPEQWAGLAWIVGWPGEEAFLAQNIAYVGPLPKRADDFAGKTINLDADLDMGGIYTGDGWAGLALPQVGGRCTLAVNGETVTIDSAFAGSVGGRGHQIYNFYSPEADGPGGLFGAVRCAGQSISWLWVSGGYSAGKDYAGGLIGEVLGDGSLTVRRCAVGSTAEMHTDRTPMDPTKDNPYPSGLAEAAVGGVIGLIHAGASVTMQDCAALGTLEASGGTDLAGALVGRCDGSLTARNCYSDSALNGGVCYAVWGVLGQEFDGNYITMDEVYALIENWPEVAEPYYLDDTYIFDVPAFLHDTSDASFVAAVDALRTSHGYGAGRVETSGCYTMSNALHGDEAMLTDAESGQLASLLGEAWVWNDELGLVLPFAPLVWRRHNAYIWRGSGWQKYGANVSASTSVRQKMGHYLYR